jgi:predicted ATPase
MRLDRLEITNFKNLRGFAVDFDERSPTTVLVGRNGTGKSNLLEALTIIFRDLDLGVAPSFDYVLEYMCRGRKVKIEASADHHLRVSVDGIAVPHRQLGQVEGQRYLPNYVFGYYSGPSNRMQGYFETHQERFYRDLLDGKDQPLRPLFYARPIHSQFVLLAFFLKENEQTRQFLREHLGIEELDSVLFVMNEPTWQSRKGDERFWYARGTVSQFLDHLHGLALAPLRLVQRVSAGFRKTTSREHLYLYLKDVHALRGLSQNYVTQQDLFKALESTYISELIREVRIRVKARNVDGSLTFRELSEGEQQLLMVLGLLRFTKEDESLFLLDEPDTHLNPAWSLRYLEFLREIAGAQENSHIIMATHDPLVIAGLTRSQVQIMRRQDETGRITAEYPADDPKGMGVAGLLTSEVYGLRSELDLETLGLLDEKRELAVKESLTDNERSRLAELDELLRGLDFTTTVRDPLYKRFVEAMSERERAEGLRAPVLTKEQQDRQKVLAREVLANLGEDREPKS